MQRLSTSQKEGEIKLVTQTIFMHFLFEIMYDNYEVKTGNTATHLAHGYVNITTTAHLKNIYIIIV